MEAFQRLTAHQQDSREQQKQKRNCQRNAARRALARGDSRDPKRAAADEKSQTRARQIQNDCGNQNTQSEQPEDPAIASEAQIVLTGGEKRNRADSKQIGRLIAIRKRPEPARVDPERKRGVREKKQNTDRKSTR